MAAIVPLNPTRPSVLLNWAGRSVTEDLSDFVTSITYTESLRKSKAGRDKISLVLNNRDRIFCDAWYPQQGDTLKAGIAWTDLATGRQKIWRWGAFTIDDVRFRFGPDEVIIGAMATAAASDKMEQKQNRAWDNISLRKLCELLSKEAGMSCTFTGEDVIVPRIEQRNESSRELLTRLAGSFGLEIASKNESMYVGTPKMAALEVDLANRAAVRSADIVAQSHRNTAQAVVVEYYDPEKKEVMTYSTGKVTDDKHTQHYYDADVGSMDEAKRFAQSKMTDKRRAESRIVLLNTPVAAGQNIILKNAGKLPAKWRTEEQTTSISISSWQATVKMSKGK
ncbi:phage late control D family protein [Citrobacter braakii]|uniref:phage late control D family protein n=1 Tax=Citrobacter braakii TaxID=57706 RepID=UPI004039583D